MVDAICQELRQHSDTLTGEGIETIYFGGGTPSVLLKSELIQILDTIKDCF